jgi:peptide deformylase
MSLKIVQAGDPVLRQPARALTRAEILSRGIQELVEEMREAMRSAPGVGLAAPQVGRPVQLAVIEDRAEYHKDISTDLMRERGRQSVPFQVLINPVIVNRSDENKVFFEGCLSLPGFSALVPRSQGVRVEYLDQVGSPQSQECTGWLARIVQHECDHLQGTLYVDRMLSRSFSTLENLSQYWKNLPICDVVTQLKQVS